MPANNNTRIEPARPDTRRAYWLQQYATAYANRDKRGAAMALQFLQATPPASLRSPAQQT